MKALTCAFSIFGGLLLAQSATAENTVDLPPMQVVDTAAIVPDLVLPKYPAELLRSGVTGKVDIEMTVTPSGRVRKISVIGPANYALSDAARQAVRKWRFVPVEDSSSVRTATVSFSFELEGQQTQTASVAEVRIRNS